MEFNDVYLFSLAKGLFTLLISRDISMKGSSSKLVYIWHDPGRKGDRDASDGRLLTETSRERVKYTGGTRIRVFGLRQQLVGEKTAAC